MASVYGKMRFVVNKEMINIRGWDDLKCAPRLLFTGGVVTESSICSAAF